MTGVTSHMLSHVIIQPTGVKCFYKGQHLYHPLPSEAATFVTREALAVAERVFCSGACLGS